MTRKRKARITKRSVDALPPGQSLTDTEMRGFVVRRLKSGLTVYGKRYTDLSPVVSVGTRSAITEPSPLIRPVSWHRDWPVRSRPAIVRRKSVGRAGSEPLLQSIQCSMPSSSSTRAPVS